MTEQTFGDLVRAKLAAEGPRLARLEGVPLKAVEKARLRTIRQFAQGRIRGGGTEPAETDRLLLHEFLKLGAKAILSTGAQRSGDFLNNQLRGRWAEDVVQSMSLPDLVLVPFGPSGAAMPGQEDHRRIITSFREIELIEGKRPDLLMYDAAVWKSLTAVETAQVSTWPTRLLEDSDLALVRRARCGVEVKNSTWHYATRRKHRLALDDESGGPLSVTVKDEELKKIVGWIEWSGRPVLFFQVLFDEMYVMSFSRMVEGIRAGQVYEAGDYLLDTQTGAGGKKYHRFFLKDLRHLCAFVRFPNKSEARVEVLASGSVIPYVRFLPAATHGELHEVIVSELAVADRALAVGIPVLP